MAARKVFLVGWDAADWKVIRPLMEAGKMPNVRQLVENGAAGRIATLHPPLSPMLWTSIATGKRPFKHGIHGFSEPTPNGRGIQPVTNLSRKSKALWNILNQNGLRSVVIGWWPSHPAEPIDGVMVSDHFHRAGGPLDKGWPLVANGVHPPELAAALAGLRMHPDLVTPEMVEPFIPLAREIDQDKDKRLALLMRTIAECMSMHSAAIWLLGNQPDDRPWDFFSVYYDAIDHFCHGFMKYHPPRQSWIPERDFDLYHNVVSMAYQFHDRLLGELLEKACEDTTIVLMSDHGFHPDHLRPASIPDVPAGPAIEHSDFGILAMRGPNIRKGEVLHGASVLDVAPTILTVYGLPAGEDFDGKVLSRAFVRPPKVSFIPSWEEVPGADGSHPPHTRLDPVAAHEALEQMIALGYIEQPDENSEIAVNRTLRELRYNLGLAYQDDARHIEAHGIFAELHAADPDEQRFAVGLFVSCQALGLLREMRRIVDDLDGRRNPVRYQPAVADYLNAQVLTAEKRYDEALAALERIRPPLYLQTGDLYLRLGKPGEAERVYEKALTMDPDNAHAHLGLCRVALRRKQFSSAAQMALNALEHVYHDPQAHLLLGLSLTGLKEYARAAEAFRAAISFNPNFAEAHSRLAILLGKHLGDTESAREHRLLARRMRSNETTRSIRPPVDEAAQRIHAVSGPSELPFADPRAEMPPVAECLIVVTGLPRSGTSMLLHMLAAGGIDVLSDGLRKPDEDNPRGYLEYEPIKSLGAKNQAAKNQAAKNQANDEKWLFEARGRAVKIVVPLLEALPPDLACRVILAERDPEAVLDSQERMLVRRNQRLAASPERRRLLREEYARMLGRARGMLTSRPGTQLLAIDHRMAISSPYLAAEKMNKFLGGGLNVAAMAAAIDPTLYRNRSDVSR
jgi:predicted AlkP superfamily phosphohydrolase/phosphomutase/tetratricopeptide (TPR) repeat protein